MEERKVKGFIFASLLLISPAVMASTNLSPAMGSTCEELGPTSGAECVKLQRQLESENVILDLNAAAACSLIWQWGSHSDNLPKVKDKVLSCFRQVANQKLSDEARDTCEGPVKTELEGFATSTQKVLVKANKMLACIQQLAVPILSAQR